MRNVFWQKSFHWSGTINLMDVFLVLLILVFAFGLYRMWKTKKRQ